MRTIVLSLVAGAAMAAASAASATSFIGSTTGCFSSGACALSAGPISMSGITFTGASFDVQDSNGFAAIGTGTPPVLGFDQTLGFLSVDPSTGFTGPLPFQLLVSFTSPGSGGSTYFATIIGSVTAGSGAGGIQADFDNTAHLITTTGGAFTLTVNDTAVSTNGTNTPITGFIQAVPEPATWAMMLLGFGGIGFAMRRRRQPALAQVA
jgi:hypothetical protein